MQILVRASPNQHTKIQDLLKETGELGGTVAPENTVRANTRVLTGSGKTIESILSQMEYTWPAAGNPNKIKVHRIQRNVPGQLQDNLKPGAQSGESFEERRFREEYGIPPGGPVPAPAPKSPADDSATKTVDPEKFEGPRGNTRPRDDKAPDAATAPAPAPAKSPGAPAAPAPSESKPSSKSYRFQFISYQAPAEESKEESEEPATPDEPAAPVEPQSKPGSDIIVVVGPGTITIASEDLDALDKFEAELRLAIEMAGGSNTKEMHYIPLKHAKAQVAATLVTEVINGAPASSDSGGGGGSLMGDLASSMMGDMFGGLLGGFGGGGSSSATTSVGGLSIIPDIRNNALFVNCTQRDLMRIEDILTYIDTPEPPGGYSPNPAPRFIPVENTTADSVATVVRSVYAGRLTADASGGQQRQPSPEDFVRALRGGRGGQQQQNKGEEQKMTIGVDTRTNSLVVVAPDYMFEEVKALVKVLDVAELPSDTVVRVKSLRANADVVSRSLGSLYGDSITITKTSNAGTTTARPGGAGATAQRPAGNTQQRPGGNNQQRSGGQNNNQQQPGMNTNQVQQIMNAMQGGGRGSRGGGSFGGGSFGGRGGR